MTTTNEAREIIYAAFVAGWTDPTLYSAYTFDEEPFVPPAKELWVRLSVRNTTAAQETLGEVGHRRFDNRGIMMLQIFTPRGEGKKRADAAALKFKGLMASKRFVGVDTYAGSQRETGVPPGDAWDQVLVEVPFAYYEVK